MYHNPCCPAPWPISRRDALSRSALGMGWLAAAALLAEEELSAARSARADELQPRGLSPRLPHYGGSARRVILLFQHGGPSQIDLFDPKPALAAHEGKVVPGGVEAFFDKQDSGKCMPSPFKFSPHGESGMVMSELLPNLGACADDLCQIRSMHTELNDHEGALRLFQTGQGRVGRPTLGAWVTYALGSQNRNLPGYVVLSDPKGFQVDGIKNWSAGWLPAVYQGTPFRSQGSPLFDLDLPERLQPATRRAQLQLLAALNERHRSELPHLSELEARIANFELGADIRDAVIGAMDVSQESAATHELYGTDQKETAPYGTRCLMARRLLERGVRFVSVFNDMILGDPWDTHFQHNDRIRGVAKNVDRPSAALINDLKQRGMLEDTLVILGGRVRPPAGVPQGKDGRDHNRYAFTILFGRMGGVKPGLTYGRTDDFGYKVQEKPVSVNDLQATIPVLLGARPRAAHVPPLRPRRKPDRCRRHRGPRGG